MNRTSITDRLWTGVLIGIIAIVIVGLWNERRQNKRTDAVLSGHVRGNEDTRIFHVPTCPQYDSIKPGNVREFATVANARAAHFQPSTNCLEDIGFREAFEDGDVDPPSGSTEDPRN